MIPEDYQQLRRQLIRDEGFKNHVYKDQLGNETIGVGHNLSSKVSDKAVEQILLDDITNCEQDLDSVPWTKSLSSARRGVLLAMCFNMGFSNLVHKNPKVIEACHVGDYETAADEMLGGTWEPQVGDRARRLSRQMRYDIWQ